MRKRKIEEISPDSSNERLNQEGTLIFEDHLARFEVTRRVCPKDPLKQVNDDQKLKISIRDQPAIDKGYFNLPKDVIEEAFGVLLNVVFGTKKNTNRDIYYYHCAEKNCFYKLKITENQNQLKNLTIANLISNFKNFDISNSSELSEGICFLTEYGEHNNNHHKQLENKVKFNKTGKSKFYFNKILGISPLLKNIINIEKYYLSNLKSCQMKINKLCENNRLLVQLPSIEQLRNYIYRYRENLIAQNYPEVKQFLTDIVKKNYHSDLQIDEMFFIYSNLKDGEVSILFSSKALIENLLKQQTLQPSFIHVDATYKLTDLGLPLIIISTETINHNYRPVAFFLSWSESTAQIVLMISKLEEFLRLHFDFSFQPKFVLTDNCDALISGCRKAFTHEYVHLGCHFHLAKRMKEKAQSSELKDKKKILFFGLKALKNSPTLVFFKEVWKIISRAEKKNSD